MDERPLTVAEYLKARRVLSAYRIDCICDECSYLRAMDAALPRLPQGYGLFDLDQQFATFPVWAQTILNSCAAHDACARGICIFWHVLVDYLKTHPNGELFTLDDMPRGLSQFADWLIYNYDGSSADGVVHLLETYKERWAYDGCGL